MTHAVPPRRSLGAKLAFAAASVLGACWLFGLVSFVAADGHFEATLPRQRQPGIGSQNLALWDLGPTVRASSYYGDWKSHHHPLFVVDGRAQPDLVEKWASAQGDRRPWLEIRWREPHDLERVVIRHAGSVEADDMTAQHYRVECLTQAGRGLRREVEANHEAIAQHDLACAGARGVRVEFIPEREDIVRIFEVETWGR